MPCFLHIDGWETIYGQEMVNHYRVYHMMIPYDITSSSLDKVIIWMMRVGLPDEHGIFIHSEWMFTWGPWGLNVQLYGNLKQMVESSAAKIWRCGRGFTKTSSVDLPHSSSVSSKEKHVKKFLRVLESIWIIWIEQSLINPQLQPLLSQDGLLLNQL